MGVNRLSVGVQSFEEPVLKTMGRVNGPAEEVKDRLLMAQGKFDTLNVDFVFNFPGQTIDQFAADVAAFKELGIDQATFYPLMASPHKKDALERRFNRVDSSRERQFYEVIMEQLYHGGYTASTAWCFSRGQHIIDEYIIEYDDYIGIGAGSVSIVNGDFYANSFSLDRYHEMTAAGRLPIIGRRHLSNAREPALLSPDKTLRHGAGPGGAAAAFRRGGRRPALAGAGLFPDLRPGRPGDGVLRVTEKGMYPVSVMMRDFFAALNALREHCIERQI